MMIYKKVSSFFITILWLMLTYCSCMHAQVQQPSVPAQKKSLIAMTEETLNKEKIKESEPKKEEKKSTNTAQKKEEGKNKEKKLRQAKKKESIELNFENASLQKFLDYVMDIFDVTFIFDDGVPSAAPAQPTFGVPTPPAKPLTDIKINFRSHRPMTESQIWSLVDLFLETANYSRVAQPNVSPKIYRIIPVTLANKAVLPTYIGTPVDGLPDHGRIRYIYFAINSPIDQLRSLVSQLKSTNAQLEMFSDVRALILTDNAYNIKSLIKIIQELDTGAIPEVLSIVKLQNSDASDFVKFYDALRGKEDQFRRAEIRRTSSFYFPPEVKIIPEPRTNSLIMLGSKDVVRRIEDFIVTHYDTKLRKLPSPIHVYELNYAPASQLADILNAVTAFGQETDAGKFGGMRSGEKYFNKMFVQADTQGNRLLIRGSEEDFKLIRPTIQELDQRQPQVVIEVLITSLRLDKNKAIQSQLRNPFNEKINFQTSGFFGNGVQVDTTNASGGLITNLINLATSAVVGTTVFTLGKESVWAILGVLQKTTELNIVSNPFLVATNKYQASVSLGETRRVISGEVVGGADASQNQISSLSALLEVKITPQINRHGIINLDIDVKIEEFTRADPSNGDKSIKSVHTNSNVADGEVLALGGLIKNTRRKTETGFSLLSKIPIVGYLFKNRSDEIVNDNLLIFMTPRVISPHPDRIHPYTQNKAHYVRTVFTEIENSESKKDPIYQWWFKDPVNDPKDQLNTMVKPDIEEAEEIKECVIIDKQQCLSPKGRCSIVERVESCCTSEGTSC